MNANVDKKKKTPWLLIVILVVAMIYGEKIWNFISPSSYSESLLKLGELTSWLDNQNEYMESDQGKLAVEQSAWQTGQDIGYAVTRGIEYWVLLNASLSVFMLPYFVIKIIVSKKKEG